MTFKPTRTPARIPISIAFPCKFSIAELSICISTYIHIWLYMKYMESVRMIRV